MFTCKILAAAIHKKSS